MSACPIVTVEVPAPAPAIVTVEVPAPVPAIVTVEVSQDAPVLPLQFNAKAAAILSSNCFVALDAAGELIRADGPGGIPALGFVRQAAVPGDMSAVLTGGIANGFTGLLPSAQIYLGAAGQATQTPPATGLLQELGEAISATRISLQIEQPIHIL